MTYRPTRGARLFVPAVFVLFAVVGAVVVVATARGDGPPVPFLLVWLAALGWNAYWWLLRICTEVSVDGQQLSWRTPVRRATAPLADVTGLRGSRISRRMAVIELSGRRPLLVPVRYGFGALEREITAGAPGATVQEH